MTLDSFLKLTKALVDQVSLDENGMMVGNVWMGGNGGLLSRETVRAADAVRKAIAELEGIAPDDPDLARALRQRAKSNQL